MKLFLFLLLSLGNAFAQTPTVQNFLVYLNRDDYVVAKVYTSSIERLKPFEVKWSGSETTLPRIPGENNIYYLVTTKLTLAEDLAIKTKQIEFTIPKDTDIHLDSSTNLLFSVDKIKEPVEVNMAGNKFTMCTKPFHVLPVLQFHPFEEELLVRFVGCLDSEFNQTTKFGTIRVRPSDEAYTIFHKNGIMRSTAWRNSGTGTINIQKYKDMYIEAGWSIFYDDGSVYIGANMDHNQPLEFKHVSGETLKIKNKYLNSCYPMFNREQLMINKPCLTE